MAPKYSKHAILEGIVDYFCLVCETHFISENESDIHVGQKDHINKLNATHYVNEFKEDGIRKINKIYFCELCNKLIPSLVKVRLHITELTHVDKRNFYTFERIDNFVIAFKEIVIDEQSWHSFYDKSCAICNIEYDNEETHKAEATHILNLILVKAEFDKEKNLYRKIDNESCHCITCNILVASNTINSHFNEIEHKNKIESCKDAINKIKGANIEENKNVNDEQSENIREFDNKGDINAIAPTENTPSPKYSDSTDLLENISKFQKNGININFELNIAFCKKCNLDIDMKVDAIENHIDEHNKKPLKKEKTIDIKSGDDKAVTIKKHSLYTSPVHLKKNAEKSIEIDNLHLKVNSVENIDKHNKMPLKSEKTSKAKNKKVVSKKAHIPVHPIDHAKKSDEKDNTKENFKDDVNKQISPQTKVLKKVRAHSFVTTSMVAVKNDIFQDFVINNKFCINCMSFFLITPDMKCLTCKVRVDDIAEHAKNPNHNSIIHNTVWVITEFDSEFIREITKDVYHCGYCNITKSWDEMEAHLKTVTHSENKNSSFWRLQMYLSDMGGKTPPFITMEQFVNSSLRKN